MDLTHSKKITTAGLLITLGIIYGDIGTSPLYTFQTILGEGGKVNELLVYGAISCVFWTLTLQTTFKYVILTLQADNKGEGGVFSLYALVRRYGKKLMYPAIIGAGTLLADGIITPPISVTSAIEGLGLVKGLETVIVPGNNLVVEIVLIIILLLFVFQRFGTKIVGGSFGPIMFIWFSMLAVLGTAQVIHYPFILKALSPHYGLEMLIRYPHGFYLLGAVFLCTTGAEALYSDLGHCGRRNIRISWIFVKITLVLNYLGQGAWVLMQNKTDMGGVNPFFAIVPHWFLVPSIFIATAASIIASQALISGSFTLISEAISLNFWPKVTVKFPSDIRGQIYIPSINWVLCLGCFLVVLYFKTSEAMTAAYGFSITVAMLMTTILMYYFLRYVKHLSVWLVVPILVIFVSVAFLTDLLDGFLARTLKMGTQLGKLLDSSTDYVILFSLTVVLGFSGVLPVYLLVFILIRLGFQVGGVLWIQLAYGRQYVETTFLGKASLFVLMVLFAVEILVFLRLPGWEGYWAINSLEIFSAATMVVSTIDKALFFWRKLHEDSSPKAR